MTRARATVVVAIIMAAAGVLVALQAYRASSASARLSRSREQFTAVSEQLHKIHSLRTATPIAEYGARPKEDLLSTAGAVLADAGIASSRLVDLAPQSDQPLPATPGLPQYNRQTVRLHIGPLSPPELGAFLEAWRRIEPVWQLTHIEMTANGESGQYSCVIHVSAIYVGEDKT